MTTYRKYPRTAHLPFSAAVSSDDIVSDDFAFWGQEVVVTEKMDGENTTLYRDYIHARSTDSRHHSSRDWAKQLHGQISYLIPDGTRVVTENMYARHSISYNNLESFLYGIAVIENGTFWDWETSELMFAELNIPTVPVLWRGIATTEALKDIAATLDTEHQEGFVVRTAREFPEADFQKHVGKYVRPGHVQTDTRWTQTWTPNTLAR